MPKVAPKDEEVKPADVVEETLATPQKGEVATAVKPALVATLMPATLITPT